MAMGKKGLIDIELISQQIILKVYELTAKQKNDFRGTSQKKTCA
jgi:hypothetical protein